MGRRRDTSDSPRATARRCARAAAWRPALVRGSGRPARRRCRGARRRPPRRAQISASAPPRLAIALDVQSNRGRCAVLIAGAVSTPKLGKYNPRGPKACGSRALRLASRRRDGELTTAASVRHQRMARLFRRASATDGGAGGVQQQIIDVVAERQAAPAQPGDLPGTRVAMREHRVVTIEGVAAHRRDRGSPRRSRLYRRAP